MKVKKQCIMVVIIIGMVLFPFFTTAQSFEKEHYDAYYYARSLNITTMPNIYMADFYGKLTRSDMAKMMVNYAKNVLGKQANINIPCGFVDIQDQSAELQEYIIEACQMGIMGVNTNGGSDNYFYPDKIVTRAEFGTAFSRVIRWNTFDGAIPFYADHLFALNNIGVMKDITTPYGHELKWWVMVMMMRLEKNEEPVELMCDTPENIFYCDVARTIGVDLCPQECVMMSNMNAGILELKPFIQENYQSKELWGEYIASLKLETKNIPIGIQTITLYIGEPRAKNLTLRLERDGEKITRKIRPNAEGVVTLPLVDSIVKAFSSDNIHLIANDDIKNIQIKTTDDVISSALFIMGTYPIIVKK